MIEISQLFSQINQIEPDLELDIHHILKKMIKEHFKDEENKCRELLTMISKSIFKKNLEGLTYKEKTEIRMKLPLSKGHIPFFNSRLSDCFYRNIPIILTN